MKKYDLSLHVTVKADDVEAMRRAARQLYALLDAQPGVDGDSRHSPYRWTFRHPSWESIRPFTLGRRQFQKGRGPLSSIAQRHMDRRRASKAA